MSSLSPQQFHPNLHHYQSGGMGHLPDDESRSVVGMVPISTLKQMPGNRTWDSETRDKIRNDVRSGHGLENPLMVMFSPRNKVAVLGEGNHRLEALEQEGHTHAPVRVVRTPSLSKDEDNPERGQRAMHVDPGPSPFGNASDPNYWPSDIHPSYIFHDRREDGRPR